MNSWKTILEKDIESLDNEKNKIGCEFELLNKEKAVVANDVELLKQDKDRLRTDVEFLKEEKNTLHKFLDEEKAEFVDSAVQEILESIPEREKTLAKNEKVVARERIYIQELLEVRQEIIKQMGSEKATKNRVIGVKKRKRGDLELWNFREKKRATLKEVISYYLNRTDK
ncbi:hypothetical protein MKW98_000006 [Papaver atlanticum]|uniref:Uncharacterized protein n=1 Tax=Papaver atlanticum TaxID=357466 RepID=A0AAD4S5Y6_9MAGN|nr:hypothetical protein MKW98_000006 [Papaver atlanticum]